MCGRLLRGPRRPGEGGWGPDSALPTPSAPARLRLLRPEAEAVPTGNSGGRLLGLGQRKTPGVRIPRLHQAGRAVLAALPGPRARGDRRSRGQLTGRQDLASERPQRSREQSASGHPRCGHSGPLCRLPAWGPRLTANQPSESLLLPYPADAAGGCGPGQQRPAQWAKGYGKEAMSTWTLEKPPPRQHPRHEDLPAWPPSCTTGDNWGHRGRHPLSRRHGQAESPGALDGGLGTLSVTARPPGGSGEARAQREAEDGAQRRAQRPPGGSQNGAGKRVLLQQQ